MAETLKTIISRRSVRNFKSDMVPKDIIEKMYFGETFDDNIHIQIAYNIMDIKKIFSSAKLTFM